MRVLLFGGLGDLAGWRERRIESPPETLSALRRLMTEADAALGAALSGPSVLTAVNKTVAHGDMGLNPEDEIAFLPPMSGG